MESQELFKNTLCGCCAQPVINVDPHDSGCEGKTKVFTSREENVLRRIREATEKVRELKRQAAELVGGAAGQEEKERISLELDRLRQLRSELEEERLAAADERMRILGHL